MTFNSQKINTDPRPWVDSRGLHWTRETAPGSGEVRKLMARPQFDNNPNPILVGLRRAIERGISVDTIRFAFASCDANPPHHITRDHIEHARRVLMRLGF